VRELLVAFITSLDGYASGEGWPGWWGLQGPEYLAGLGGQAGGTHPSWRSSPSLAARASWGRRPPSRAPAADPLRRAAGDLQVTALAIERSVAADGRVMRLHDERDVRLRWS